VNDRPYLSIGEVLELLKHDFPDLSISRIRAFESAGQLELERTASGYRKFYESDISYLRGLLGGTANRLAASPRSSSQSKLQSTSQSTTQSTSQSTQVPLRQPSSASGKQSTPASYATSHIGHADEHDEPLELGPNGELPGDPERRHPAAFQSLRRELAERSPALPPLPAVPALPVPTVAMVPSAIPDTAIGSVESDGPATQIESPVVAVPVLTVVETPAGHVAIAAAANVAMSSQESAEGAAAPRDLDVSSVLGSRNPLAADASGLNLSLDELVKASGLTNETIRDLESLGLLKGQGVFSAVYYDEDALLTCKLVASFQKYGVEPRHLRMYKLAADREASFFEQVVTPQLRRRNPDARQSAIETLGELVRLGEQLRIVALRQVLRSSINR
jgi:DNA-binding transcriptional MerR regulator